MTYPHDLAPEEKNRPKEELLREVKGAGIRLSPLQRARILAALVRKMTGCYLCARIQEDVAKTGALSRRIKDVDGYERWSPRAAVRHLRVEGILTRK